MNCCLQDDVRSSRNDILAQIGLLKDEVLQMRGSSMPKFSTDIQDHLQPIRDKGSYQEDSGHDRKDTAEEGGEDVRDKGGYQEDSGQNKNDTTEEGEEEVRAKGGYIAEERREDVIEEEQPSLLPKYKVGWRCDQCTFYNTPYRPGCEMCGSTRPNSYIPPPDIIPTVDERMILEKDKEAEEQVVQVRNVLNILNSETLFAINLSISTVS